MTAPSPHRPAAPPFPFHSVAVIGLGLIGGSLARALRKLPAPPHVVGFSPSASDARAALAAGAVDRSASSADEAAAAGDLVVYAAPLAAVLDLLGQHKGVWRANAVVTDLAGLKTVVASRVKELGLEPRYVGAHPMAGGEGSGFPASRDDLFRGASVWLVGESVDAAVRERVEGFWTSLGAIPAWTDPVAHDQRMIRASHLPQLVSNALASVLADAGLSPADLGPGGRDMTRLAGSSPSMWRDLLERSAPSLAPALREVGDALSALANRLEAGDLDGVATLMQRTRDWAARSGQGTDASSASERPAQGPGNGA